MPPIFSFTDGLAGSPGPFAALAPPPVTAPDAKPEPTRDQVERALMDDGPAVGYVPSLPIAQFTNAEHDLPPIWRYMWDLPAMLLHPRVSQALSYYRGGISGAKFRVTASSPAVKKYVEDELSRFWHHSRDQVQDHGYSWGWAACQANYTIRNGLLCSDLLEAFESRDVQPLTVAGKYVGFRVNHVQGADGRGHADYWGPGRAPARGVWYTHRPRKGRLYGFSVPYPSWRPWRRAAGRDGAEQSIDAAFYRFGCAGPVVRYPHEDTLAKNQPPGSQAGSNRQSAGEKAREFAEQAKSGAGLALTSRIIEGTDKYAWGVEWPKHSFEGGPFLDYLDALNKQIDAGIGVPSELIEASDTGSGFSGRRIPLEGYLATQQTNATSIVRQWKEQQGDPLVRWNFGRSAWFDVEVESLLDAWQASTGGASGTSGADPDADANAGGQHTAIGSREEVGPRGGHWKVNPATGAKYHAAQLATGEPMQEIMPAEPAKLGCALLELPAALAEKVLALAAEIDPADIVPDGREDRPHVTARFGFRDGFTRSLAANIADAVHGMGPISIRLGPTGVFQARETGADHDVVYVTVESPALHALHRLLADVPHIDTHPRFCPHVTLAYVNPGRGLYYAGDEDLDGETVELDTLTVSDGDKRRSRIKLDGSVDAVAVELATVAPVVDDADDWLAADSDDAHRKAVAAIVDAHHDDVHAALLAALALLAAGGDGWWKSVNWDIFAHDIAAAIDPIFAAHDAAGHLAAKRAGVAFDPLHDGAIGDKRAMRGRLVANIVASTRAGVERVAEWAAKNDVPDADTRKILAATAGMGERQVNAVLKDWKETHKKKGAAAGVAGLVGLGIGTGALAAALGGVLESATEKTSATVQRGAGDALWGAAQAGQVAAGKQGERIERQPVERQPAERERPPATRGRERPAEPEPAAELPASDAADADDEIEAEIDAAIVADPGATKTWYTEQDGDVCDKCQKLHDVTVPIDEPFPYEDGDVEHPPAHPHCRCHVSIDRSGAELATRPPSPELIAAREAFAAARAAGKGMKQARLDLRTAESKFASTVTEG